MKRPVNLAASIRQRLLNEAKRRGESFDYIASLYARERFLARLEASPHRHRLILKGATVLMLWVESHRTTRDLDFLGLGAFGPDEATTVVREIVEVAMDDGLLFDAATVTAETIREQDEYQGVRVNVTATLDGARVRMQIDIAAGDVVTPAAKAAELPAILEHFQPPKVKVYPPETIVAEKLHAVVKLGIANSRMKDFFDLYILASAREFDGELLAKAVARTFQRRKTDIPPEPFALSEEFYRDRHKETQWLAFVSKSGVEACRIHLDRQAAPRVPPTAPGIDSRRQDEAAFVAVGALEKPTVTIAASSVTRRLSPERRCFERTAAVRSTTTFTSTRS